MIVDKETLFIIIFSLSYILMVIAMYLIRIELLKILKDSLTGDSGMYSSKKLSMALCLWTAIFMALWLLLVIGKFDIDVFKSLLIAGGVLSGLGVTDKYFNDGSPEPVTKTITDTHSEIIDTPKE
jgi:hypothetical protein